MADVLVALPAGQATTVDVQAEVAIVVPVTTSSTGHTSISSASSAP